MDSALLGVPLYTLAAYKGMGDAPPSLRRAGLIQALGAPDDRGDIILPKLNKDVLESGVRNLSHFSACTSMVFRAAKSLDSDMAFVVGGECSLTPGMIASLSESFGGKPGMLWMDAHGDFNTPETSPSGYIGGMALAMSCGLGPRLPDEVEAHRPLVPEESLVHVGARALDPPEVQAFNASPAKLFTAQNVRKTGAADVAEEAARHLANRSDWIVCHLDVDVVDPTEIPAVNYPTPGGLTSDETAMIIRTLAKTGKMRVLELTAYNASSDRGRSSAKAIVGVMKSVFG